MKLQEELKLKMESPINYLEMTFEEIMSECLIKAKKGNDSAIFWGGSFQPDIIERLENERLYVVYTKDKNYMYVDWSEKGRSIADSNQYMKVVKLNLENMERMHENDSPWWQFWK